jgi:hypothetical protein
MRERGSLSTDVPHMAAVAVASVATSVAASVATLPASKPPPLSFPPHLNPEVPGTGSRARLEAKLARLQ